MSDTKMPPLPVRHKDAVHGMWSFKKARDPSPGDMVAIAVSSGAVLILCSAVAIVISRRYKDRSSESESKLQKLTFCFQIDFVPNDKDFGVLRVLASK
jgi:hypothetical protein